VNFNVLPVATKVAEEVRLFTIDVDEEIFVELRLHFESARRASLHLCFRFLRDMLPSATECVDIVFFESRIAGKRPGIGGTVCSTTSSLISDQIPISSNLRGPLVMWFRGPVRLAAQDAEILPETDSIPGPQEASRPLLVNARPIV
jgi:hypothetical protein